LNPVESLIPLVEIRHGEHDRERRKDKGKAYGEGACRPALQVAHPHGYLRRERTRHRLPERDPIQKLVPVEPSFPLDQIALHVSNGRDRPPEAEASKPEEIPHEPAERDGPVSILLP